MQYSCLWVAAALAASVHLAAGCGSDPQPPASSPTFESRVGEATRRVEPAQADPLVGGPGSTPSTASPGPDMATPPTRATGPSEREMCDALLVDAKLHVEDIQGGAALVITPKTGGDLDALKQAARTIEGKMPPASMTTPPANTGTSGTIPPSGSSPGGTTGSTGATSSGASASGSATASDVPAADACALFDLGRQGARASVAEQQKAVRILLTASDPANVKSLRARAREFVRSTTQTNKPPSPNKSPAQGTQITPTEGAPPTK